MQIVLIIAFVVIAGVLVGFAFGLLRLEKKNISSTKEPEKFFTYGAGASEQPGQSAEDEEEEEELVDLVDYYADYDEDKRTKTPAPSKKSEAQEAKFDKLCNLKVGRGYLLDCQNLLMAQQENNTPYAMAYFDFNRFRIINTLKGFSTGDYAITRIAQEAQTIFPAGALISRIAADHFTVLFPYIDDGQLQDIFEQLKLAAERIRSDIGAKHGMQICMGVALANSPVDYDIFKLMRRSNIARHCIKATKGENYSMYDDSMVTSYLFGESSLDDYNEHQYSDDFSLYLSPLLLLTTKRVSCCAAHARWIYEEGSDNALNREDNVTMSSNFKVAYHLCRAISRWRKADGITLPALVTLNELDLLKEDVDAFFARCLGEFQLDAAMIIVVVSQHNIRLHPDIMLGQLLKLKNIGLKIAVCDFDRDTQSLDMLGDFKPDFIKLHRSFVHDLEKLPERQENVRRIIDLVEGIGSGTIFEGVDSTACVSYLVTTSAKIVQGKYVGYPATVDEFTREMKELLKVAYDPNTTVVLDDEALQKGNFKIF